MTMQTYQYTDSTHQVVSIFDEDGVSRSSSLVSALPEDAVITPWVASPAEVQGDIVTAVQSRLDSFARTRNYDGILSACTYATSTVPRFKSEGQTCVDLRDQTWAALYTFLASVQAGTAPMPTGYSDIEPLLPVLTWGA